MKHPVLVKVFSIFLLVMCLISLASGLGGLGELAVLQQSHEAKLTKLDERIDTYQELQAELDASSVSADQYEKQLEEMDGEHNSASSDHQSELAMYSATKGGLVLGQEALDEAAYAINMAIKQYYEGLAAMEEGRKSLETMKDVLQSVEPKKAEAAAAAADCAVKAAELEQLILIMSQPLPTPTPEVTPTPTPEVTPTPTPEVTPTPAPDGEGENLSFNIFSNGQRRLSTAVRHYTQPAVPDMSMQMMGYVMKLQEYGALAAELAAILQPVMPEGSIPSGGGGGFDMGSMGSMSPVEKLTVLKSAFEATGSGLNALMGAVQQMEESLPAAEQQLTEGEAMLEQVHQQLIKAGYQLGSGRMELQQERDKLIETEQELQQSKAWLEEDYKELGELRERYEARRSLENKHKSARILLMSYEGIEERVNEGAELVPAAEQELESLRLEYERERRLHKIVSICALVGAAFGVLAFLGAFELLGLNRPLRVLSILCLDAAALAYVFNYYMCAEQHYIAIFTGLFALILALFSGRLKKKVIAAQE